LLIVLELTIEFNQENYEFDESFGLAVLELTIHPAIECCSVSVTVKLEDITAKGKMMDILYYICIYVPVYPYTENISTSKNCIFHINAYFLVIRTHLIGYD